MKNINKISVVALLAMAAVSVANLFGLRIAGISVFLGIAGFFLNKKLEKQSSAGSGFDFKAIGSNFKEKSIWFWVALPLIMDAVSIALGRLLVPGYTEHVLSRVSSILSFDKVALLAVQLAILALGEEIAWRAFFQNQLQKVWPITPVLLLASLIFGLGHIASGNSVIVVYDVFFVFVNSILYGVIFYKTKNAWMSAISHFLANLFSIVILVLL